MISRQGFVQVRGRTISRQGGRGGVSNKSSVQENKRLLLRRGRRNGLGVR